VLPISKNIFKPDKKQQKSQEHSYFINIITVCIVGITKLCYTSSINVTKVNVMSTSEFEFILSNEIHTLEKLNKSTITSVMGFTFIIEKQQYAYYIIYQYFFNFMVYHNFEWSCSIIMYIINFFPIIHLIKYNNIILFII
jgi:hypothetical protein